VIRSTDYLILGGGLFVFFLVLRASLWRAWLFLKPTSMRIEADAPGDQVKLPTALDKQDVHLRALGFKLVSYDYAHPEGHAFATLWLSGSSTPRLYFLTPCVDGAYVITADYKRPAFEDKGRYLSGSMEDVPAERVFKAHERRLQELKPDPSTQWTLEGRVEAGKRWYAGVGQREVRAQNVLGLLWTVGTFVMIAAAVLGRRK
jgi:hypothetical protein